MNGWIGLCQVFFRLDDRGNVIDNEIVINISSEPHAISTGNIPPNPNRAVAIAGPPIRARLNRLCSNPSNDPCSSLSTLPVVCVVNPVAKTCCESACNIDTTITCIRINSTSFVVVVLSRSDAYTVTIPAIINPKMDRAIRPVFIIPNEPRVFANGDIANAPNAATANIPHDITNPNCCGSNFNVCVNTRGITVECIEAHTPPMTFTISNGQIVGRKAISAERRVSSRKDLLLFIFFILSFFGDDDDDGNDGNDDDDDDDGDDDDDDNDEVVVVDVDDVAVGGSSSCCTLLLSGRNKNDKIADNNEPATANFAPI